MTVLNLYDIYQRAVKYAKGRSEHHPSIDHRIFDAIIKYEYKMTMAFQRSRAAGAGLPLTAASATVTATAVMGSGHLQDRFNSLALEDICMTMAYFGSGLSSARLYFQLADVLQHLAHGPGLGGRRVGNVQLFEDSLFAARASSDAARVHSSLSRPAAADDTVSVSVKSFVEKSMQKESSSSLLNTLSVFELMLLFAKYIGIKGPNLLSLYNTVLASAALPANEANAPPLCIDYAEAVFSKMLLEPDLRPNVRVVSYNILLSLYSKAKPPDVIAR
jgi:hypothetical protein